jgi:hypothetical protein
MDRIQAPAAYPPITTTGVLASCVTSMASKASTTIKDAVFANNNSTATLTRACRGVSANVTREGSTPLVAGASHNLFVVLTTDQTISGAFTWSIDSGSNGTIVAFAASGSSCSLDATSTALSCERTNPLAVGPNNLATITVQPTSCTQRLALQPQLDPVLPLNARSTLARAFSVACGPPESTDSARVSPSPL